MPGFEADPAELFAAQARVLEATEQGWTSVGGVRSEADELVGASWTGQAAQSFGVGLDDWLAGAHLMLAGLEELAAALGAAAGDYERAESANDSTLRRIAS